MNNPKRNEKGKSIVEYHMLPKSTQEHISNLENLYLQMYTYSRLQILGKNEFKILTVLDDCFNSGKYKNTKVYLSREKEKEMLKKIHMQVQWIINTYKTGVVQFELQIKGRLIVGNSGGNYGNTAIIAIHPTYCVPYIPSSAIKGAFRSYLIYTKYNGDENMALQCDDFRNLFGGDDLSKNQNCEKKKKQKGGAIFFDAFPKDSFRVEQDVQTVHYPKYYSGQSEPTDDMNRIPINMYAVGETNFLIAAVFSEDYFSAEKLPEIKSSFQETFTEFGIGAKTALGYGLGEISK